MDCKNNWNPVFCFLGSSDVYQLELDVSSIHFFHHPLFSYEHVLSSELEKSYLKYSTRDIKATEYYSEKVIIVFLLYPKECYYQKSHVLYECKNIVPNKEGMYIGMGSTMHVNPTLMPGSG